MAKRNRHSYEFKQKIVEEYRSGVSTAQDLGRKHKVHPTNIYQWAKKHEEGNLKNCPTRLERLQSKEIEYYKKKVAELTRDIDLLKKLQEAFSQSPKRFAGFGAIIRPSEANKGPVK